MWSLIWHVKVHRLTLNSNLNFIAVVITGIDYFFANNSFLALANTCYELTFLIDFFFEVIHNIIFLFFKLFKLFIVISSVHFQFITPFLIPRIWDMQIIPVKLFLHWIFSYQILFLHCFLQWNITGGENSSLIWDLNPGSLVYHANTPTTEPLRPNLLTNSHIPLLIRLHILLLYRNLLWNSKSIGHAWSMFLWTVNVFSCSASNEPLLVGKSQVSNGIWTHSGPLVYHAVLSWANQWAAETPQ